MIAGLCRGLAGRGVASSVASLGECGYREPGVEVISLGRADRFDPLVILKLVRLILRLRPDIVHSHGRGGLLYSAVACRLTSRRLVHTVHRSDGDLVTSNRLLRPAVLKTISAVTAVSSAARDAFCDINRYPRDPVSVVYNGVDLQRHGLREAGPRTDSAAGTPVVGTVCNLSADKDIKTLVEAFAILSKDSPSARLIIAGDGPESGAVKRLISVLGMGSAVEMPGAVDDVAGVMGRIDVFVLSSHTEGLGIVLLEAMAAGVPVVASRVGGIPEIVVDGETGLLFEQGNATALRNAVESLFRDRALRSRLVTTGLRMVTDRFSVALMCDKYREIYERAKRQGGRGKGQEKR